MTASERIREARTARNHVGIRKVASYWVVYVSPSVNNTAHYQFRTKRQAESFAAALA